MRASSRKPASGLTGKGAIAAELRRSLAGRPFGFKPALAVVTDPAGQADIAASSDDYLIASGLLNGIVSGLVSRSILSAETVRPGDFHACVTYQQFAAHDRSRSFVDRLAPLAISSQTRPLDAHERQRPALAQACKIMLVELARIAGASDRNRIKPGIAEATRAVLRRVPDRLFLRDPEDADVAHLVHLAAELRLPIEPLPATCSYRAVAIIRAAGADA
jgi:hypothetical protein